MKIQTRKIVEEVKYWYDEITGEKHKYIDRFENGYVEEKEIDPKDISTFSMNKSLRIIGVGKKLYPLTLKSWKQCKIELSNMGILQKFNYSKAS